MIVIGGTVGVGKTTVAEMIGNFYKSPVFYESVDNNPLLEKFYSDPKTWAFPLQIYFFQSRYADIQSAINSKNICAVMDRSIYEDHLFTLMNYERGNMTKEHYDTYVKLFDVMMNEWKGDKKRPELFVYLRASFDTVLERMKKRNRAFEMTDELHEYFKDLHSRYDDWVFNSYDASQILVVDMDKYDVTREEDKNEVMQLINVCVMNGFEVVSPEEDMYIYKFVAKNEDGTYSPFKGDLTYTIGETVYGEGGHRNAFNINATVSGYCGEHFSTIPGYCKQGAVMIELVAKRKHMIRNSEFTKEFSQATVTRELSIDEYPPNYIYIEQNRKNFTKALNSVKRSLTKKPTSKNKRKTV